MADALTELKAYGDTICALAEEHEDIVLVAADVATPYFILDFAKQHFERFYNTGVAEQNMMGICAGLAAGGLRPYAHTYCPFATMRACEQIRNDLAYTEQRAVIVGMAAGINFAIAGTTHHATEDIAIMSAMANVAVMSAADGREAAKITRASYEIEHRGPVYLRLGRFPTPAVYEGDYDFEFGKGVTLREGGDVSFIATGHLVYHALEAAEALAREGIDARVINLHTIKPLDRTLIARAAAETGAVVTAEEHNVVCGFGAMVARVLAQECPVPVECVGIDDVWCSVGTHDEMFEKFGLTSPHLAAAAKRALARKG
jgi:transketolase